MKPVKAVRAPAMRAVAVIAVALLLAGCTRAVAGTGSLPALAPNAQLAVVGTNHGTFDQLVENSISDVTTFWKSQYPTISNGDPFPALTGKLYSVDGDQVTASDKQNACLTKQPKGIVDNAFYCQLDDSVAWDRDTSHLVPVLAAKYGRFLATMVFAHEFGHAVQERLGIFKEDRPTISIETQADCAAGAFTAWAMNMRAPHFRPTTNELNSALIGYLQVRDSTPETSADISHGDGFDRLSAVSDGIDHGVTYCFSSDWINRQFTERPYTSDSDYTSGGNEPLSQVTDSTLGGLAPSLNAFWKSAAQSIHKPWTDVKFVKANRPKCQVDANAEFAYCPNGNTVYYSDSFAHDAYYSMSGLRIDRTTADVSIVSDQPGDYALGTMFVYAWGMAVRHQLFGRTLDDKAALLAAGCYAGAYSKSINDPNAQGFALSPPDMDEATNAVFTLVSSDRAFGGRGTSALDRINSFNKGYFGGLSAC